VTLAAKSGDYTYEILDDGTAKITAYAGAEKDLIIPDTLDGYCVTKIGEGAFYDADMESVIIPDTVREIGSRAFESCFFLQSVTLPTGITRIAEYTFHCCYGLKSIVIPEGVTVIKESAFQSTGLEQVILPESLTAIEQSAFYSCKLIKIVIPAAVTYIGNNAFHYSKADYIFKGLPPEGITKHTFDSGHIGHMTLHYPSSLEKEWTQKSKYSWWPDDEPPSGNPSLPWQGYPIMPYSSLSSAFEYILNSSGGGSIITGYTGKGSATAVPQRMWSKTVRNIGTGAFSNNTSLTKVVIPQIVVEVEAGAFDSCPNLKAICFPNEPPIILDPNAFVDCHPDMTIYYNKEWAVIWAPNGETEWNGYPIVPCVWGNVSGNGTVSANDAARILRHLVELETLNDAQLFLADVDWNGSVNAADAAQILRYLVQLIPSF